MTKQLRSAGGITMALAMLATGQAGAMQAGGETFSATASVASPTAKAEVKVTIRIDRFVSDAERDAILAVVKGNNPAATQRALNAAADIGYIEIATRRTPIKYAYARATGDGRLLTVVTARPVLLVGASVPGARPPEGFELALALLILDGQNKGDGEIAPAARVKMNDTGALVTDDYAHETVRLTGIARVK
jgi:hypothetical protein